MSPSITELKKRIKLCEKYKKEVYNNIGMDNAEEWLKYYNEYINYYNSEIKRKEAITAIPFVLIGVLFIFYIGSDIGLNEITALVVGNETGNITDDINEADIAENITLENITEDGSITELNITFNITEFNIAFNITELGFNITETLENETNAAEANITENITEYNITNAAEIPKINIKLEYKSGTLFDENDNGIANLTDIVDFTVENTEFNWDADNNLCARYKIESLDNKTTSFVCYGDSDCCNAVELIPVLDSWDDSLNIYVNRYDAGLDNVISAQVLFYNITDIYYSLWSNLTARFMENVAEIPINISNITIINITEINITANVTVVNESIRQYGAVIGKPVRWEKRIKFSNSTMTNITIPKEAINFSVKKIIEDQEFEISEDKIKVNKDNIIKTVDEFELDKITGYAVRISSGNGLLSRFLNWLFNSFNAITGYAVIDAEEQNETEIIIEEAVGEVKIEYYTEAPVSVEKITSSGKKVIISAELNYTDILTFASIPEANAESIKLYWHASEEDYKKYIDENYSIIGDGIKIKTEITYESYFGVSFVDSNENGLIDTLYWITPHTSSQEFEISLTLLTLKSHPQIGSNWTVTFNVTGSANLTIRGVNGTLFGKDIVFKELRCNDELINVSYNESVFVENYSCFGIGRHEVTVLTFGSHYQEFDFGGIKAIAENEVGVNISIDFIVPVNASLTTYVSGHVNLSSGENITDHDVYVWINGTLKSVGTENIIDDNAADFNSGTFNQTNNQSGDDANLTLNWTNYPASPSIYYTNGTFISRIFDAGETVSWQNISWGEPYPYGEELLNGQSIEEFNRVKGGVNMTGNVLLMHMNDGVGNGGTVQDTSGHDNNGAATFDGTGTCSGINGKFNIGCNFDGTNDRIAIADSDSLNPSGLTISAWIKPSSNTYSGIVSNMYELGATKSGYSLLLDGSSGMYFGLVTTTADYLQASIGISVNKWQHVAGTYNGSSMIIYINGEQAASQDKTGAIDYSPARSLYIGYSEVADYFNGTIDEAAVWNRSLSKEEVNAVYQRGLELKFQVRSANESTFDGESFVGYDNTSSTYFNNATFENISAHDYRYFQYKAFLDTVNDTHTPYLEWFNVSYYSSVSGRTDSSGNYNISAVVPERAGTYEVIINLTYNNADFRNNASYTVNDVSYPSINLVNQTNDTQVFYTDKIYFSITDNININNIWYSKDSGIINDSFYNAGNVYELNTTNWKFQRYDVYVWANDTAGNLNSTRFTFNVTGLNITIVSPATIDSSAVFSVSGHVNLSNGTNITSNIVYIWINKSLNGTSVLDSGGNYINNTLITPSSAGVFELLVNLTYNIDWSSNFSLAITSSKMPVMSLVNNTNGTQVFYTDKIYFNITDDYGVRNVWYSKNSGMTNITPYNSSSIYELNTTNWQFMKTDIYLWANDTAGNINSTRFTFNVTGLNITIDELPVVQANQTFYVSGIVNLSNGTDLSNDIFIWFNGTLQTIMIKVYNFSSANNKAYEKNGTVPSSPFDYRNEASTGNYTNIATSDNNRWITSGASSQYYESQIYLFNLSNDIVYPNNIISINITWEGYGENTTNYTTNLSIWNWSSGIWYNLNATDFTSSTDSTINASISSGFNDYVNFTTKQIALMVVTKKAGSLGEVCTLASQCASGYCVDGVCCDTSCTGSTCQRCDSYSANGAGHCSYVGNTSIDPDNECTTASPPAADSCKSPYCNGSNYACGYLTGEQSQPACNRCNGTSYNPSYAFNDTKDTEGSNLCSAMCNFCDNVGNCKTMWWEENSYGSDRATTGSQTIICIPSKVNSVGYAIQGTADCEDNIWTGQTAFGGGSDTISALACRNSPFVYNYQNSKYILVSDFIPTAISKEKEFISFTEINNYEIINNKIKLKITEELNETAYIDNYYLKIFEYKDEDEFNDYFHNNFVKVNYNNWKQIKSDKSNNIIEYNIQAINQSKLTLESDDDYLVMEKGFEKELEFDISKLQLDYKRKIFFIAEGYYRYYNNFSERLTWDITSQIGAEKECNGFKAERLTIDIFNKTGEEAGYTYYDTTIIKNLTKGEYGCGDFSYYRNVRNIIKAEFSNYSGNQVRIALQAGNSNASIANLSICERDNQNCADELTMLYWNGNNDKLIYPNNLVYTDWANFSFDETKDYLVTFYWKEGLLCYGIEPETNSYYITSNDYSLTKEWKDSVESIAEWIQNIEVRDGNIESDDEENNIKTESTENEKSELNEITGEIIKKNENKILNIGIVVLIILIIGMFFLIKRKLM